VKKILTYATNHKGVTLVLMALMLALLIMFASLAIDISYMYFAKNQLQVAADAAALAGAAKLTGEIDDKSDALHQEEARQSAWKFACKNKAAGTSVYLVTNNPADCDANSPPTYAELNGNSNTDGGDIVVGNWDSSTGFTRATGGTDLKINAIRARARRTNETPGMPQVGLFLGKIFKLIGTDWSFMSVQASAIAKTSVAGYGPFPMCEVLDCGRVTPLTTISPNLTPGIRWFLKKQHGPPNTGWTTFLDNSTSQPDISAYVTGIRTPPDICNQCIYTTNGVVNPSMCETRTRLYSEAKDYVVNGVTIRGWKTVIPLLPVNACPSGHSGCFSDPSYQPGDPYRVTQFAEVIMTDAVPQGNCPGDPWPFASGDPGFVFVGTGPGVAGVSSSISCLSCDDPYWATLVEPIKLVK